MGAPFLAKPMIYPMCNDTILEIEFLRAMTKTKSITHLTNKRTFGKHSKVIANGFDAKLKAEQASSSNQTGNAHSR